MNREMYKKERQIPDEKVKQMLTDAREGTLAMYGDDGYPYALPMNYVYLNDAIYIHTAKYGYKIDALNMNQKVCFSVIVRSKIAPELFTTKYESIVATCDAEFIEDDSERHLVMETFIERYSPDFHEGGMKFIKASLSKTAIVKLNIKEVKGKAFRADKW